MTEDQRKIIVNAQITAVIAVSEFIGLVIIFIVALVTKSSTIPKIIFTSLELIILPYAFLMNTNENKSRIIEKGWTNILRNSIRLPNILMPREGPNDVVPFENINNNVGDEIIISRIITQNRQLKSINSPRVLQQNINGR